MAHLMFEWSDGKDASNQRKHRVGFEKARSVFLDEDAVLLPDEAHSGAEGRFVLLGMSSRLRGLVVCHCYRSRRDVIRIISAPRANAAERRQYEQGRA